MTEEIIPVVEEPKTPPPPKIESPKVASPKITSPFVNQQPQSLKMETPGMPKMDVPFLKPGTPKMDGPLPTGPPEAARPPGSSGLTSMEKDIREAFGIELAGSEKSSVGEAEFGKDT